MKYYLIYCHNGIPVDVGSFDDEDSQMKQFFHASHLPQWLQHLRYDSVHILNQVC